MAVPVARVHLKVAHAALPALLPTPPKWKILPTPTPTPTLTPPPCLGSVLRKPPPAKPGRADTDERWDAHKPGRADAVDRWDAHKKARSPASSSSSVSSSFASSRATSDDRWDVHKKHRLQQAEAVDDGENSSAGSNDDLEMNTEEEEEVILWKPRVGMYAGSGFAVAAPKCSKLPVPTALLVPVA